MKRCNMLSTPPKVIFLGICLCIVFTFGGCGTNTSNSKTDVEASEDSIQSANDFKYETPLNEKDDLIQIEQELDSTTIIEDDL